MQTMTCSELASMTDADLVRAMQKRWPEEQAYRRGVRDVLSALALYLPIEPPAAERLRELMDSLADAMLDIVIDRNHCHPRLVDTLFSDGRKIAGCFRREADTLPDNPRQRGQPLTGR